MRPGGGGRGIWGGGGQGSGHGARHRAAGGGHGSRGPGLLLLNVLRHERLHGVHGVLQDSWREDELLVRLAAAELAQEGAELEGEVLVRRHHRAQRERRRPFPAVARKQQGPELARGAHQTLKLKVGGRGDALGLELLERLVQRLAEADGAQHQVPGVRGPPGQRRLDVQAVPAPGEGGREVCACVCVCARVCVV